MPTPCGLLPKVGRPGFAIAALRSATNGVRPLNEGPGDAIRTAIRWVADRILGRCTMRRYSVLLSVVVVLLSGAVVFARPSVAVQEATPTSDLEANKALARKYHDEIFEQGNLDAADEILTPDFVWYSPPRRSLWLVQRLSSNRPKTCARTLATTWRSPPTM